MRPVLLLSYTTPKYTPELQYKTIFIFCQKFADAISTEATARDNAIASAIESSITTFSINNAEFTYIKMANLNILQCNTTTPVDTYNEYDLSKYIRTPKSLTSFCLMNNTTTAPTYNNKSNTLSLGQVFVNKFVRVYGATAIGGSGIPYQRVVGTAVYIS